MEVTRIFDLLDQLKEKYPNKNDILSIRAKSEWIKYSVDDYYRISYNLSYGFLASGFKAGDKVIVITQNRPEWNFLDMALALSNLVSIPVYSTLSRKDYMHIITHSEAKAVFIGNEQIFKKVMPIIDELENKPIVYTIDEVGSQKNWKEILEAGEKNADKYAGIIAENKKNIKAEDMCTIIYTSGTTGTPKGVMLKHGGLTFNAIAHAKMQIRDSTHRMLSFLPLCHIYERSMNYEYQYLGISIYYAESLGSIARDMKESHADGFCAVPRVMEMMYDKLLAAGKDMKGIKKFIYNYSVRMAQKFDYKRKGVIYKWRYRVADKLVYSKWREVLGGHELLIVSGGSSIQEKIVRLYSAAKMYIFEGYGLTETSPVIAVNNPKEMLITIGTVGKKIPGIEMKIDDDGEILTKGVCLMLGYYKDSEYTAKVIDEDGWFHTGDIGKFDEEGYLKIIDRKKEIFKTSSGKYIAPQVLENKFKESKFIENIMIIGENEKFASAIITPNFQYLHIWAKRHKIKYKTDAELASKESVIDRIRKEVNYINEDLAFHEQLKRVSIVPDEWSSASGELSQTMKLKRSVILKKYEKEIKDIYSHN